MDSEKQGLEATGSVARVKDGSWDARELLQALATGHVRLVPKTPYGAELTGRIDANVRRIVGVEEVPRA